MVVFEEEEIEETLLRETNIGKMKLSLEELRERIGNLEDNLQFCQRKYYEILAD